MNSSPQDAAERIHAAGLIAIIRGGFSPPQVLAVAEVLARGGVRVLEVTLNTTAALEGITLLKQRLAGEVLVGAGTVRTVTDVDRALDAGAEFLVAPNLDLPSVRRAAESHTLHLPGVFTATEAQAAFSAGCRMLKLFPADACGPAYLKALRAPLSDIAFVPTGGINEGNLEAYVRAGAVAFGVGSALVREPGEPPEILAERAERLALALAKARGSVDV